MKTAATLCTGLLLVVVFAAGADAQGQRPVIEIDTPSGSGLAATGTPFGNGVTGPVVGLSVPAGGITNSMLAGSIDPAKITGTAATLGANNFTGNQSITGNLSVTGTIALPDTANSSTGVLMLGGQRFVHNYGTLTNTFVGRSAGNFSMDTPSPTPGDFGAHGNTGIGFGTLSSLSTGRENTAVGKGALGRNTTAFENTSVGFESMFSNLTGVQNIAIGFQALQLNTTGHRNIVIGFRAGNTAGATPPFGSNGDENIYIGEAHGPSLAGENNTIRIGNDTGDCTSGNFACQDRTFIAGISGVPVVGDTVFVDANGQLGTLSSSRRFKDDIRDMSDTTNSLFRLRPVTFRYKQAQSDGSHPLQYGLVAEEVARVYPELVQYDPKTGEPNSVMYQYLTPMLLNEVQKEHAQIESLEQQIQALKEQLTALAAHTSQR